jgi:para-nitrobenzyl esterase
MRWWLVLLFCSVAFCPAHSQADSHPVVTIDSGMLVGAYFGTAPSEVMFLGIPYAAPPVGERGWRPPQPVEKWQGTRKADSYGAACPPAGSETEAFTKEMVQTFEPYYTYRTDEDCLYLNAWTTNLPGEHAEEKLPVRFWIHGGGNVSGFVQESPMSPMLARKGVVVVSIKYRLGALGFLAHPTLTAESPHHTSGSYGILDQIAALEWVEHLEVRGRSGERYHLRRVGGGRGRLLPDGFAAGSRIISAGHLRELYLQRLYFARIEDFYPLFGRHRNIGRDRSAADAGFEHC